MGVFSSPQQRNSYVPPFGRTDDASTFLGGASLDRLMRPLERDPNLVRVSDGNIELAQQPLPNRTGSLPSTDGRDPSNHYLKFDGRYLKLYDGDTVIGEWPAVSGKENFGSPLNQDKRNYGPMPEGTYDIKQDRYQTMSEWDRRLGSIGLGKWAGGASGWGTERVWVDPTKETVANGLTFGRTGMAIHGGSVPGSAGCIDLTSRMEDFAKTFRRLGRDLKLYVDYSPPVP